MKKAKYKEKKEVYANERCMPTADQADAITKVLNPNLNYYELLGVSECASHRRLTRSFKRLALILHPDKNPHPNAEVAMKVINCAFSVLRDTALRSVYDFQLYADKLYNSMSEANSTATKRAFYAKMFAETNRQSALRAKYAWEYASYICENGSSTNSRSIQIILNDESVLSMNEKGDNKKSISFLYTVIENFQLLMFMLLGIFVITLSANSIGSRDIGRSFLMNSEEQCDELHFSSILHVPYYVCNVSTKYSDFMYWTEFAAEKTFLAELEENCTNDMHYKALCTAESKRIYQTSSCVKERLFISRIKKFYFMHKREEYFKK